MFENIRNVITRLPIDRLRPNLGGRTPGLNLTIYGLNDVSSPKDVHFGGLSDHPQYYGVQNPQKGGVIRHFPAKVAKL